MTNLCIRLCVLLSKSIGMRHLLAILIFFTCALAYSQADKTYGQSISFQKFHEKSPNQIVDFGVKGDLSRIEANAAVHYKYSNNGWHFIRCTSSQLTNLLALGTIQQVYFEPHHGHALNDTMRIWQNIDSVHNGESPLIAPFTGKDVVIGYIDTGIDFNHDDFKNADGSTRVLYYWDHTLGVNAQTPSKYGYGQVWDSSHVNAGTCTSLDNNAHGTTVSGAGSGNGLATGTHKGAAPESDIIIVETDFSLPNWTLTVADGVDYIFSMADSLGKPVIVNTSVGTYFGSHDGLDPASQIIDSLMMDMPGRIVVAAAGNSGNKGKYHVNGNVTSDTSFTWFEVNMSSAFGSPAVYLDLWADTADFNNVDFAFAADNPSPSFEFRNRTQFYNIQSLLNTTTLDSIMVGANKLAPVEFYCEEVNGVYHIEAILENIDSTSYLYRFETVGNGEYDLWSGAWLGASDIKSTGLPTVGAFPPIAFYHAPDSLSTTVSSWTCSPNVVTVGNFTNRKQYLDYNSNWYIGASDPGLLSINSSKGPNRLGITKPDVSASGDLILAACPLWLSASLQGSNPGMLDIDGQHVRNGGTSMASPVIAGIAALYLEKCPLATYQDFINDLYLNTWSDAQTGTTPNNAYGYGRLDAFSLLNHTNENVVLTGDTLICENPVVFATVADNYDTYEWSTTETTNNIVVDQDDTISVEVTSSKGCRAYSDTIIVVKGTLPTFPVISEVGGGLIVSPADSIQWYYNGAPIDSSNAQFYNPDTTGTFTVEVFSPEGCSYLSDPYFVDLSQLIELDQNDFVIFPNPFTEDFRIIKSDYYDVDVLVTDASGKVVFEKKHFNSTDLFIKVDLEQAQSGMYFLTLYYSDNFKSFKLIKE